MAGKILKRFSFRAWKRKEFDEQNLQQSLRRTVALDLAAALIAFFGSLRNGIIVHAEDKRC